jgi:hypothetical protein
MDDYDDRNLATDAKSIMRHAKQPAMPEEKPGTGPGWDRPIFGAPPGGLETWVRVFGPDSQMASLLPRGATGWRVIVKSGCMLRTVGEFATEAEAIEYAAGVPVPAAPTRLVTR